MATSVRTHSMGAALVGAMAQLNTETADTATTLDYIRAFGGGKGNAEIARALSGTNDTRSLAYKAAIRNVQRYANETRTPSPETAERIKQIAQAAGKLDELTRDRLRQDGAHVTFDGWIIVSPGGPHEKSSAVSVDVNLSGDALAATLDALAQGDNETAEAEFTAAVFQEYGIPQVVAVEDAERLDVSW